jgi:hypothetical protein
MTEEGAALPDPGQAGELIDGSDQERRQPAIDRLVDGQHWQRPVSGKIARVVGAAKLQVARRHRIRHALKRLTAERRAAPRAGFDRRRRPVAPSHETANPSDGRVVPGGAPTAESVRRSVRADPEPDLDRPVSKQPPPIVSKSGFVAHQLQRADDTCGTRLLVQSQQAQRVAHNNTDAGAEDARVRQAAMGNREGSKAEIRLALAAAGWEEQQIHDFAV